jgi:hypothetical protein
MILNMQISCNTDRYHFYRHRSDGLSRRDMWLQAVQRRNSFRRFGRLTGIASVRRPSRIGIASARRPGRLIGIASVRRPSRIGIASVRRPGRRASTGTLWKVHNASPS